MPKTDHSYAWICLQLSSYPVDLCDPGSIVDSNIAYLRTGTMRAHSYLRLSGGLAAGFRAFDYTESRPPVATSHLHDDSPKLHKK